MHRSESLPDDEQSLRSRGGRRDRAAAGGQLPRTAPRRRRRQNLQLARGLHAGVGRQRQIHGRDRCARLAPHDRGHDRPGRHDRQRRSRRSKAQPHRHHAARPHGAQLRNRLRDPHHRRRRLLGTGHRLRGSLHGLLRRRQQRDPPAYRRPGPRRHPDQRHRHPQRPVRQLQRMPHRGPRDLRGQSCDRQQLKVLRNRCTTS